MGWRRQPAIFLPHGGGPWPFVDLGLDARETGALRGYLEALPGTLPEPPRAAIVVSAHWEERVPTVMTATRPPLLFDYYGFPRASYELSWAAPGAPELAAAVRARLATAGIGSAEDGRRGFDHGTFVPLKVAWPGAEVPILQLSLIEGLDPGAHIRLGRALAPFRDEGVVILGSGMSFHNLGALRVPSLARHSAPFDRWLRGAALAPVGAREEQLERWAAAPSAREAHPREEHLLPLHVVAGAAGEDAGSIDFSGTMMGWALSGFRYG